MPPAFDDAANEQLVQDAIARAERAAASRRAGDDREGADVVAATDSSA